MTRTIAHLAVLLFLASAVGGISAGIAQEKQKGKASAQAQKARAGQLPPSLDALFPPKADHPILLMQMHALNTTFTGTAVDFLENDLPNARSNYEKFKAEFLKASKLVPEWTKEFVREPVEQLGKALASGDRGKFMGAMENVGQVCHNCHMKNMVPVQQKYHWLDFRDVSVSDPVSNASTDYAGIMHFLNMDFTGMGMNLQQGQVDNARKQFEQFRTRLTTLGETCIVCHDTERKYFVDASVMSLVDSLGMAVKSSPPDGKKIERLSMAIGTESCFKCHLVHVPAALAKHAMRPAGGSASH